MSYFGVTSSMGLCSSHIYRNPKTLEAVKRQREKDEAAQRLERRKQEMQRIRDDVLKRREIAAEQARIRAASIDTPRQRILNEIEGVAQWFNVTLESVMTGKKDKPVVRARQAACWVLWFTRGYTLREVGRAMGGLDHTSVFHAIGCHMARAGLQHEYVDVVKHRNKQSAARGRIAFLANKAKAKELAERFLEAAE